MNEIIARLSEPFPPEVIHWRIGATGGDKGLALAYIDARDLFDRLDAVVGPAGWQSDMRIDGTGGVLGGLALWDRERAEWVWRWDRAGATDVEGEKGSASDALKRAGVQWGIARYLYRLESPWVRIVEKGRSKVIDPAEYPRLRALLGGSPAPRAEQPAPEDDPFGATPPKKEGFKLDKPKTLKAAYAISMKLAEHYGRPKYAAVDKLCAAMGVKKLYDLEETESNLSDIYKHLSLMKAQAEGSAE